MGKSPLDISRKLKRYHQQVKVVRRGIQVKVHDISHSTRPDFALGTYQIKGGTQYGLLINIDLPKKSSGLEVDFWGLSGSNHMELLNRSLINSVNRDTRVRFWTYPKTRHIFITFRLKLADLNEDDSPPETMVYNINYIYIDSKQPVPRTNTTPAIPSHLNLEYNLECTPHMIGTLDLKDPLKNFTLPVNFDIFEHAVLTYLLNKETTPGYLEALQKNLSCCAIKNQSGSTNLSEITIEDLEQLKTEINQESTKLEEYLKKIDNLIHHKHSLENMLNEPVGDVSLKNRDNYEQRANLLKQFLDALNIKLNHLHRLQEINGQMDELETNDTNNISEVLSYYEKRVLEDRKILQIKYQEANKRWENFQQNILNPKTDQKNQDQERLDQILSHYRGHQKKSMILKKRLDQKVIQFMSMWYQYILKCNYLSQIY